MKPASPASVKLYFLRIVSLLCCIWSLVCNADAVVVVVGIDDEIAPFADDPPLSFGSTLKLKQIFTPNSVIYFVCQVNIIDFYCGFHTKYTYDSRGIMNLPFTI